jgi:4-carboxymuconolactone decarboxylase
VSDENGRYARGLAARREVLGDEHVERSLRDATDFSAPAQEFVTEFCWGDIWSRPGLDRRTRSLINLAMLTALNRKHEFRVHVRGAINNGVTTEEIQETLLQAIVYCGAPAGLEAFREAQSVLDELAAERDGARA